MKLSIVCCLMFASLASTAETGPMTVELFNVRRLLGSATADPAAAVFSGGVSIGSATVGDRGDGQQWRSLLVIDGGPALAEIAQAYRIELRLRRGWVFTDNGSPPDWRVDFLGTTRDGADTSAEWNGPRFSWTTTPGVEVGRIDVDAVSLFSAFDVTHLVQAAGLNDRHRFLVFRVSAESTPGVKSDGALGVDLTEQGLALYQSDAIPQLRVSHQQLRLDENGGRAVCTVSLASRPSAPVVVDISSSDPRVATLGLPRGQSTKLTFSPNNWDQPQPISIIAVDDAIARYRSATLSIAVDSATSPEAWKTAKGTHVHLALQDDEVVDLGHLRGRETLQATLVMDLPANNLVNASAHLSPIWTFNDAIYAVYVDRDFNAVVMRSQAGQLTTQLLATGIAADNHHSFSLGIDAEGFIHISGDMHNGRANDGQWNYWVSDRTEDISAFTYYSRAAWDNWPEADNPAADGPLLSGNMITYPCFRGDAADRLYVSFRGRARRNFETNNGKGWTGVRISRLDRGAHGRWTPLGVYAKDPAGDDFFPARVLAWDEIGGRNQVGMNWYQTYRGQIWFDNANRMHLAWGYFGSNSLNQGENTDVGSGATHVLYARSDDGGVQWRRADGSPISLPLTPANADVVHESDLGDLTATVFVATTADNRPVVSYARGGIPYHGVGHTRAWTGNQWTAARPLPASASFRLLSDRRGVFTVADDKGVWFRSYDEGETWTAYSGGPAYHGGAASGVDISHLQRSGEIRYKTLKWHANAEGDHRVQVWNVGFDTPSGRVIGMGLQPDRTWTMKPGPTDPLPIVEGDYEVFAPVEADIDQVLETKPANSG